MQARPEPEGDSRPERPQPISMPSNSTDGGLEANGDD